MRIEYRDLVIRNATRTDCVQLASWWNDGNVMAHAGFPNGLGVTSEQIADKISDDSDYTRRRLVVEQGGMLIGEMSYRNIDGNVAEIGIKICDPSKQNHGLGKTLLSMLIKSLFDMGFVRIVLDTNLKNKRAQHVYEQLGFRRLGVRTDSWRDQLGQLQSAVDYEMFRDGLNDYAKE